MRKVFMCVLVSFVILAVFAGCGKKKADVQDQKVKEIVEVEAEDVPMAGKADNEKTEPEKEETKLPEDVIGNVITEPLELENLSEGDITKRQLTKRPVGGSAMNRIELPNAGAKVEKEKAKPEKDKPKDKDSKPQTEVKETIDSTVVAHEVKAGQTPDKNPLKGLIPFSGDTSFPNSMEWFYIPVNAVEKAENQYDWTELEDKLNTVAARGHQAVFRFFYDYPGEPSGVPSYLISKYDLEMRAYNEPNDLGGGGLCPNYEDIHFRTSMKNFIKAFGEKYDGDPRIGFITEGLLGFWGEWHNWPFDEDTSDGKPDWSISATVYNEVYEAFDDAFDTTMLVVREPKDGVDNASYKTGYHDDSFAYATLSEENGGQNWSFLQRLKNQGVYENWKFGAVGGEVYPPLQSDVFKTNPNNSDIQNWDLCVNESHASWLMCDKIKGYTGDVRDNAIKASKQLGYDLQVTTGYFANELASNGSLIVGVDIKNNGVAPFYYDHNTWTVYVGIKEGNTLVKKWATDWDLNTVEAYKDAKNFTTQIDESGLGGGTYTVCIKVANPLKGGVLFSFANEGQGEDGWLSLGTITVKGSTVEYAPVEDDMGPSGEGKDPEEVFIPGVYEAERGILEGTACLSDAVSKASNGKMVGWLGTGNGESGSVTFTDIEVENTGLYTLYIDYVLGEDQRYGYLDINGEVVEVKFTSTGGWSVLGTKSKVVTLNAGKNTIRFYNDNGYAPDIDFIKVVEGEFEEEEPAEEDTPNTPAGPVEVSDTFAGELGVWSDVAPLYKDGKVKMWVTNDSENLYIAVNHVNVPGTVNWDIEINSDGNNATGYQLDWIWQAGSTGADFVVENGILRRHTTDTTEWAQSEEVSGGVAHFASQNGVIEVAVKRSALTTDSKTLAGTINLGIECKDGGWNLVGFSNNEERTLAMTSYTFK